MDGDGEGEVGMNGGKRGSNGEEEGGSREVIVSSVSVTGDSEGFLCSCWVNSGGPAGLGGLVELGMAVFLLGSMEHLGIWECYDIYYIQI